MMSRSSSASSINADGQAPSGSALAFGARLRSRADELNVTRVALQNALKIAKQTFAGYWMGTRLPPADVLIAMSERLDVSPTFLVTGREARTSLVEATGADWIEVPEYDLRTIDDQSMGRPIATAPIRRDWLNVTFRAASQLWMTRLLSDYPAADLREGALVICRTITPAELAEGNVCLWRVHEKVVIGRFSVLPDAARGDGPAAGRYLQSYIDPALGSGTDLLVPPSRIGEGGAYHLIGRILGVMIRPV